MSNLVTRKQLAALFGVTAETICAWERKGKLKAIRLSYNTVRYSLEDVEKFVANASLSK